MALEYAKYAIEINPEFCYAYGTMAEVYCYLNDNDNFFKYLEEAVQRGLNPDQLEEKIRKKYKNDNKYRNIKKASNTMYNS